jgi:hypothetical protein
MRAAWARRKAATAQTPTEDTTEAAPRKKRVISSEARAKISEAQKKRWGKRKVGMKR